MTITQDFIKKLQDTTGKEPLFEKFWEDSSSHIGVPTFQDVMNKYAEYYSRLSRSQKLEMSKVFWEQVKAIGGTPIIEDHFESDCEVYFLMPKDQVVSGKDLYLQGDFHGYDSTDGRQKVTEFSDTGIMLHSKPMPKDSIVTYRYIQLATNLRGKTPTQHHGSDIVEEPPANFFPKEAIVPRVILSQTKNASDKFWGSASQLADSYSTHSPPVVGIGSPEKIFRVSAEPAHAHLSIKEINWSNLLSSQNTNSVNKHFKYHDTLYSTLNGNLEFADPLYRQPDAGPMQLFRQETSSLYADCTRVIHVFTPTSGQVDNVVIINDGMAYLGSDAMGTFEQMVEEGTLSENTAFVCITPLPALKTKIENDPKANMPGMGERTIDYEHRIEDYAQFIDKSLLPALGKAGLELPTNPNNRVMIGSSLSGTASLYIGLQHPTLVGGVIAQSSSPSNRRILSGIVAEYDASRAPKAEIYLSCGKFEKPGFADNTNLPYAIELSEKLHVPLHQGAHGHQFVAWTRELKQAIPDTLTRMELAVARELNQRYKSSLDDVKAGEAASTTVSDKVPSPFQTTPKPSSDV